MFRAIILGGNPARTILGIFLLYRFDSKQMDAIKTLPTYMCNKKPHKKYCF